MSSSYIVQVASKFNTSGGNTVTATFPNPTIAGNPIVVTLVAADVGGVAADGPGTPYITLSDTQGNSFSTGGVINSIYGDATDGVSFLCGGYYCSPFFGSPPNLPGGNDSVTFAFAPVSIAANCLVGLVAYELYDGGNTLAGLAADTAHCLAASNNYPVAGNLNGGLNWEGQSGTFFLVAGAALTNDGSLFTAGPAADGDPAFFLGGASSVTLNGKKLVIGAQLCMSSKISLSAKFSTGFLGVGSPAVVSGVGTGFSGPLYNAPSTEYTISGNCGVANAMISYSGTVSGAVFADASGNYVIGTAINGNYTITPSLTGYTFAPASASETVSGANITGVNFIATVAPISNRYSQPDCRNYGNFPNGSRNVNGTLIYDVPNPDSRAAGAPVDSQAAGTPVDSRVSIPENSRTAGTFGPGE